MVLCALFLSETPMPIWRSIALVFQGKHVQIHIVQVQFIDQISLLQSRSSVINTKNYLSDKKVGYWI